MKSEHEVKKINKPLSLLLAALLCVSVFTGCRFASDVPAEPEAPVPQTESAEPAPSVSGESAAEESAPLQGEKAVVFQSGKSFSGSSRPKVVTKERQYLSETPVGEAKAGQIVYTVNNEAAGKIEGVDVQPAGIASGKVAAVPKLGYKFVRWSDGITDAERSGDTEEGVITAIFDYDVLDMPVVVVNTNSGKDITSKTEYADATISVLGCQDKYLIEDLAMGIRGRGNNSWGYPKKSYKMKLSAKTNFFGLGDGKEKIWVLLANQCDQSLQRNHVSFELARYLSGIDWQPASTSVELYLNGEYVGVYLLAEDIKVSGNRVAITDNKPNEVDTGYLLELSNYASGEVVNAAGRSYMIHNDLSEDSATRREQKKFIEDYLNQCHDALTEGDQAKCEELIDLDSLLAAYLTEEIVKNLDSQWDSFYLSKDRGGKLVFGPLWDFDLSLGNANEGEEEYTDIFVGNGNGSGNGITSWFCAAMMHDWYRQMIADKWAEIVDSLRLIPQFILDEGSLGLRSYSRNFERWKIFGTVQNRETHYITKLKTYTEHYEYLAVWAGNRIEWLNDTFTGEKFVSDGEGVAFLSWFSGGGWGNWGWGGGGNQNQSSYGNDETEDMANSYTSLTNFYMPGSADGPEGFGGEGVENLFDNDKNTKYCVDLGNCGNEATVTFQLRAQRIVKAYLMRTGNDTAEYAERNPDSWVFYGSTDGENWEVIDEVSDGEGSMGAENKVWYGFEAEEPAKYKFYRFEFVNGGIMQLSEIRLLG